MNGTRPAKLTRQGPDQMLGTPAEFIAAHARSLGIPLVTHHTTGFARVPGLIAALIPDLLIEDRRA